MKLYKGKRIWEGDELPWLVRGSRILVKPDKPKSETEGGLYIPDIAKFHANFGVIVGAGLAALDQMRDQGDQIGDRVCYGQFAGIWEEWDHITKAGKVDHDHEWNRVRCDVDETNLFGCACGAERTVERLNIMDVDDLKGNEDAAIRLNRGDISIQLIGPTQSGRMQHQIVSRGEAPITNGFSNSTAAS